MGPLADKYFNITPSLHPLRSHITYGPTSGLLQRNLPRGPRVGQQGIGFESGSQLVGHRSDPVQNAGIQLEKFRNVADFFREPRDPHVALRGVGQVMHVVFEPPQPGGLVGQSVGYASICEVSRAGLHVDGWQTSRFPFLFPPTNATSAPSAVTVNSWGGLSIHHAQEMCLCPACQSPLLILCHAILSPVAVRSPKEHVGFLSMALIEYVPPQGQFGIRCLYK